MPSPDNVLTMVTKAIVEQHRRLGSSLAGIKKYIEANYDYNMDVLKLFIKKCLKKGVREGYFEQTSGVGCSGRFRLNKAYKSKDKISEEKQQQKQKMKEIKEKQAAMKRNIREKQMKLRLKKLTKAQQEKEKKKAKREAQKKRKLALKAKKIAAREARKAKKEKMRSLKRAKKSKK